MEMQVTDFSLDATLKSGQTFTWKRVGDYWFSFVGKPIRARQIGDKIEYYGCSESEIKIRLGLSDDITSIKIELDKDDFLDKAIQYSGGLRVINDHLWPTTLGFILSIQSNIPLIQRRISAMSEFYGEVKDFGGMKVYNFPSFLEVYDRGISALRDFKLGFRTKFVMSAAENFSKHNINESMPVDDIKERLLGIKGVGEKVLDCILLYGLHDLQAFPMDVWMLRIVKNYYPHIIKDAKSYRAKREMMIRYFGRYSGYAQLFLYNYSRLNGIRE